MMPVAYMIALSRDLHHPKRILLLLNFTRYSDQAGEPAGTQDDHRL